jgi:hypothetical protein
MPPQVRGQPRGRGCEVPDRLLALADEVIEQIIAANGALFAAVHWVANGTKRTYRHVCFLSALGAKRTSARDCLAIAIYEDTL